MKKNLLILVLFAFNFPLLAQNITGSGNVSSYTDVLLANALVRISPVSDTNVVHEFGCDKNGNYSFDFAGASMEYIFKITPTSHSLQFISETEGIKLINGNNGMLFHEVMLTGTNGISFTVVDTDGNPVPEAKVLLYDTKRKWRVDSASIAKPVYTNDDGQVEINSLLPLKYWFNVSKDYQTNKFTITNTGESIDTSGVTEITIQIRDLSQNEFYLCGLCDNKTWITDSIVIFGNSIPYDADSKLLSDGTWYDSNGNHGFWWFNEDETVLTYDYDSTSNNGGGSTIDATLIELTDTYFAGEMDMFGLPATYYMSAEYDTVNLFLSANDTTIYLNSNGEAFLMPDDLIVETDYCFTCTLSLSQTVFDINDIGDNEVYVTLEDRCGNTATDTIVVTVISNAVSVNEKIKPEVRIYPNPADEFIIIESYNERIIGVDMFDVSGRIVNRFTAKNEKYTINTSGVQRGIYFVRIFTDAGPFTKKIVVE
jgi:hypothetical protein